LGFLRLCSKTRRDDGCWRNDCFRNASRYPEGTLQQQKSFEIRAEWDGKAGVWWCSNDKLPLTTEAPSFEQFVSRVLEIAPEIAAENGLAAAGDEIEVHVVAECVEPVRVVASGECP
jgi:hypothetical protein